ncbi:peptide chain release factor H [Taibaiella soli]|uniref:Peptide chain release factor H n=1 Tax=Taibaiella soli TaxID=1649169 RepID=A0A2W2AZS7_9BACT|nr:peptide chain release factor H [Taibaiella soli]PZF73534.1 peptide chain release factor H [Taibaiella soli]
MYLQISSGRGPAECCRVVAKLVPVILKDAIAVGLTATVIDKTDGDINGTLQSALIQINGKEAAAFAQSWNGTVQWIAQSPYRKFHKRKNWFVSVQSFEPVATNVFSEREISYTTCRSSGPGGQHVNKTETAVRATHNASGISVVASDSRSQHQNKKLATERLLAKITAWQMEQQIAQAQDQWQQHNELERGNAIRVITQKL